jgi:PiT family inorganic phosphate transporter
MRTGLPGRWHLAPPKGAFFVNSFPLILLIVFIALAFDFSNGWHDAANSIATIVSTRVLTPLWAVLWAAFWNFIAAFVFGTAVASTIGGGLVRIELVDEYVLIAGLVGAILWNLLTLMLGLPTSSSHALIGGYGGAALAKAGTAAIIGKGWVSPLLFIFLAPIIGLGIAIVVTVITTWAVRQEPPQRVDKWFRRLQLFSAAGYSLGHGTNDAQKSMGIITAALMAGGLITRNVVPYWVIIVCHLAMAGGTMAGGWRVVRTMGQRITKLNPFGGFAAETSAALTLLGTAHFGIPVSTTHTITGSIVGVGSARRLTAVRWGVTRRIVWAWVLTIPGAGLMGALLQYLLRFWGH